MDEDFDFEDKEQEDEIDNEKHWKSLGIAIAVISVICTLIICAILILTPGKNDGSQLEPYTLAEVVSQRIIRGHRFNGTWISVMDQTPRKKTRIIKLETGTSPPGGVPFPFVFLGKKIGSEFLFQSADKNILSYDCQNGTTKSITSKLNTTNGEIVSFEMSPSRTHILLMSKKPNVVPRENLECDLTVDYYIYDLLNENMINLEEEFISRFMTSDLKKNDHHQRNQKSSTPLNITTTIAVNECAIQSALWNPTTREPVLLVMHGNNIYWMSLDTGDHHHRISPLTTDGSVELSIYNGLNDYVYRDFIFQKPTSIWWSPSGKYFCYLKINNSFLPLSTVFIYDNELSKRHYRYPIINSSIGQVDLWIIELGKNQNGLSGKVERSDIRLKPPDKLKSKEHYIGFVDWIGEDKLIVLWTLRDQKQSILGSCVAADNWKCTELVSLRNWLRMNHVPHSVLATAPRKHTLLQPGESFPENESEFLFCGQIPENGVKAFHQLYSFNVQTKVINSYLNMAERQQQREIQHYQAIELLGYNHDSKLIFFVGQSFNQSNDDESTVSEQDMRINLFVFSIEFNSVHCLTCQLVKCFHTKRSNSTGICIDLMHPASSMENDRDEESCIFRLAHLSPSAEYAIINCLIGIIPKVYLVKFTTKNQAANFKTTTMDLIDNITLFEDNSDLEARVDSKMMPNVENFIITRENDHLVKYLRIKLLTPTEFNPEEKAKYPMIFEMFPPKHKMHYNTRTNGASRVFQTQRYPDLEWAVHMVTQHDFVYAWLDGQFYQDYNHSIHERSFEESSDDYSTMIQFIQSNMTFVNPTQTCLIGQNLGAFFVLNSLSTSSIECGIAISPFTDWNGIVNMIPEQYLDLEKIHSNDLNYLVKISLNHKNLIQKNLLIIHGTMNELFPITHTMQLMKRLTMDEQNNYIRRNLLTKDEYDINMTSRSFLELYVDQGNSFDELIEHFYRKIELFLFQWIIA